MKRDDIVTANDFSWFATVGICMCDYVRDYTKYYKVLDTGCHFPLESGQPKKYRNDTTIQAIDSGEILIIHGAFLRPVLPKHKVMVDIVYGGCVTYGEIVEISDELYKQIKK